MSTRDLATLTRMWEQWDGPIGDPEQRERFRERWWHPEIRYVEDPRWPGSGSYEGREAVTEVFEAYMEVFEGELTVERTVEAGIGWSRWSATGWSPPAGTSPPTISGATSAKPATASSATCGPTGIPRRRWTRRARIPRSASPGTAGFASNR